MSDVAGTTTDPVEKPMELLPVGPVLFIDTAGIDDQGTLGALRVEKTRRVFDRTDVAIIVTPASEWGPFEEALLAELDQRNTPPIVVFNKADLGRPDAALVEQLTQRGVQVVSTVANAGDGVADIREALIQSAPSGFLHPPALASDLVPPGELAILVVPIDMEAPKGRLILPQVQTIRDLLDGDAYAMVVKERELRDALARLNRPPALVVTDSQAFLKVAADTPLDVPMTSFSILFARQKGDLVEFVRGALEIDRLQQFVGGSLDFTHYQGHDFPDDLDGYQLVIHCGGCIHNRRQMLSRIVHCRRSGVPITNYGLSIAYTLGIFEGALGPFPAARDAYRDERLTAAP